MSLVPLHPSMYADLHSLLMVDDVSRSWRTRGRFVPTTEFEALLTRGVAFSCSIVTHQGRISGLVELFDLQQLDGHAQVAVAVGSEFISSGIGVEATALFLDEVFARFNLRKVYWHVMAQDIDRLSSLGSVASTEGVLSDYAWADGDYHDVTIWSLTRAELAGALEALEYSQADEWKILR